MNNGNGIFSCRLLRLISLALLPLFPAGSPAQSIQFHDVTSQAGITPNDPSGFGHGSSFGDFNGDGRTDVYMISYATANFLFRNDGGAFTDIANSAGVQFPTPSDRGMAAADYDNDSDLDIYIAAGYTGNVLYRNNGDNTFSDVTSSAGVYLSGQGQGVAWGDYNNDGLLDLFVTQTDGNNVLFRQESDHHFTNVNSAAGIGSFSLSLQPVFFDVDGDGDVDLFVARKENQANLLYINNGNGTFTERATSWGIDSPAAHSQGAAAGDYDRDGDLDVYVCDYDGYNLLFRNDGAHFAEAATSAGVRSGFTGNRGALFGDFNDDGWLDVYVARSNDNKMYQNNGNGTFTDVSSASGAADANNGYSPSLADYDGDGDLDIFFSNTGQNSVLLQNDGPFHNWLQIKLVGNTSNRGGVGAKLTAWLGGQRQTQAIIAGQAYLCTGSDLTAHFALGSSNNLDSLIIQWPSGTRDRFANLAANQKLTLEEGTGDGGGTDTTPPVISNVAAGNLTSASATISWQTDESADSQVEYGLTTGYGVSTPLDPAPVTSHAVPLSGWTANTTDHYRVSSKDTAGNLAVSDDQTFQTSASILAFTDITLSAGVGGPTHPDSTGGHAAIFSDVNGDTHPDLYITMYNVPETPTADLFFRNVNGSVFVEEGELRGIDDFDGGSHGACFADLDNDGDYDLYNGTTRGAPGILGINNIYRNNGSGFFDDVSATSGIPIREWETRSVIAFDMEGDGDLDLFGVTDYLGTDDLPDDRNEVYRNDGNLRFTAIDTGALFLARAGQGAIDTDFDGDGDVDVIAANRTGPVNILRNDGQGNFTQITPAAIGITHNAGDGITTADVDNDGDLDMLLASDNVGHLYRNNGGTFSFVQSFTNTDGYMGGFADLDNDGDLDLVFAGDDVAYLNNGSGSFSAGPAIAVAGISDPRAVGFADIDHDGDLDFAVGCKRSRNWLLRNDFNAGNWLKVQLISPQGQIGAFGAKTRIYQAGGALIAMRESRSNNGYLGQDAPVLHFGLGALTAVDVVTTFLDGTTVTLSNVNANQTIAIDGRPADHVAPVISNVAASNISSASAAIAWTTNEISDSQVEYGLETNYGNITLLDPALVTSHAATLSNLQANTTYHYRVKSKDAAGNPATSGDFTFTTSAPDLTPPVISNVSASNLTNSAATITWATNESSNSQVEYGLTTNYGSSSPLDPALVTSHSVALSGLQANTTYHYRVNSKDAAGNLATSGDFTFTTSTSPPALDVTLEAENMPIKTTGTPRSTSWVLWENGYVAQTVTFPAAGLYRFTLRAYGNFAGGAWSQAELRIDQVAPQGGVITVNSSTYKDFIAEFTVGAGSHEVAVAFINDYYDPPEDRNLYLDWLRIQSTGPVDAQPPVISNVAASNITTAAATITWTTDEASDSQVEYGVTTSYGSSSPLNSSLVISHSASLSGLSANTTYHYRVKSKDAAGNLAVSGDFTFTTSAPDLTPPVISNVATINITTASATITWTTDEASDSQVEYGLNASYGSSSPLDPALVTSHTVTLSGLQQNTTYHYRVKSKDAAGNLATSADFTFATLADLTPPVISNVAASNLTATAATINWATDEASDSQVEYGLDANYGNLSPLDANLVTSHAVILSGLTASTTYHYRVKSKDAAGNSAVSGDFTFTTSPPTPAFDVTLEAENMPTKTTGASRPPGWLLWDYGYVAQNVTFPTTGLYKFTLRAYGNFVAGEWSKAELRLNQVAPQGGVITVSSSAYADFTVEFSVSAGTQQVAVAFINDYWDPPLDRNLWVDWLRIQISGPTDVQPPIISNVAAGNITAASANITWTTDEASDSQVEYGLTTSYGSSSPLNSSLVVSHSVSLSGLSANTTYHYRVKSKDAAGNLATSGDFTFTTSAPDLTPPVISNVTASNITTASATITWTTDEASDSQVEYGLNTSYGSSSPLDPALVTSHTVTLSGLQQNTTYHYRVKSKDAAGNLATSADFTFATLADLTPPVISNVAASNLTATAATINWATDEASDSQVEYGLDANYGNLSPLDASLVTSHAVILSGLTASTTYHYRVKSKDAAGNSAVSGDFTFTTSPPTPAFDVTLEAENMPIKTNGASRPPGWVLFENGYIAENVNFPGGGSYQFTLRAFGKLVDGEWSQAELRIDQVAPQGGVITVDSGSYADYVATFSVASGTHEVAVAFINDLYVPPDDRNLYVDWLRIQSTGPPDTQAPVIASVAASNITSSAATISWNTDEAADSQVEYGLTTGYGSSSPLNSSLVVSHSVSLSGLQANTTYHYRVKSKDASGNLATSGDYVLTTAPFVQGNVAFANVQGIFDNNCVRCHQGVGAPAGLVLLAGQAHGNLVNVPSTEYPQWQRVQPGNHATSWLYEKITNVYPPVGSKMGSLTADEIALIRTWIDQGATATPVPPYTDLEFRTAALVNGEINISYYATLVVWGGLPPYQFSLVSGTLPPGIALDAAGAIYGTPTTPGQYSFTIRVSDSRTPANTLDQTYSLEVFNTQDHWQLPDGFVIENAVSGLHLPVNLAFVPNPGPNPTDPYFYVTLLYGDIVMVQRNLQKQTYATGLLNFVPTGSFPGSGELGVTGITVDAVSGDVLASMVYDDGTGYLFDKIVRFHSADGGHTAATQTTILSGIPAGVSHQIQALTIGPDGKLYVNVGDGWVAEAAPDLDDRRGKILRLNLDGSIPPDNPFPNSPVYASGLRNPFGAAWRPADGKLYISDNGPEFDDRLAKILPGQDYGWNLISPDLTQGAIFLWNPTVSPVGMDFLSTAPFPAAYSGQLFVGRAGPPYEPGYSALGKKIQRFVLDGNGNVVSDSLFLDYVGAGWATVIGVTFGPDGLYFTDLYGENGFDAFGQTQGNVYRIRWGAADVTPPVISNVQTINVTGTGATIVWETDEPASRQVEYGLTPSYGNGTPLETNLLTNHSVTLSQLAPETTYYFRVLSADAANNSAISAGFTFTTTAIDSIAPVISGVRLDSLAATSALVLWNTDEPASSFVDFGTTPNYGASASGSGLVTAHRVWLTGLADSTLYHFRVRSADASGNQAASGDGTFTTPLNRNVDIDTTLEAESMAIKTNGDARSPGWVLFENGYVADNLNFPATGSYQFTLRAMGKEVDGEWSVAELRIDQIRKATITVNRGEYTDFVVAFAVAAGPHEVAVAFINDVFIPPDDRNLYVDWLRVQNSSSASRFAAQTQAAAAKETALPSTFAVQNYPNPFNAATRISMDLPHDAEIHLAVYDLAGREVQELLAGSRRAGTYEATWDGRNREGSISSSGIYLLRLRYRAGENGAWSQVVRRVLMVK